ncbi:MAG: hypothetical protein CMJ59_01900 [Planctomycetaceae bacterium]|nr:hypothetical protein [Planctomycetaceae bacterium]
METHEPLIGVDDRRQSFDQHRKLLGGDYKIEFVVCQFGVDSVPDKSQMGRRGLRLQRGGNRRPPAAAPTP